MPCTYMDSIEGVLVSQLRRWGRPGEQDANDGEPAAFPMRHDLNRKLAFWKGDITTMKVDAMVITTNERLDDAKGVSGRARLRGGFGLVSECRKSEGCRTGDALLMDSHCLPSKSIIHTVGPRWSNKYQTAAESALHSCYKRSFEIVEESSFETVAFCVVNTPEKGYPPEEAAHVALRTLRRSMEHWGSKLHTVAFVTETDADLALYRKIATLYFPRTQADVVTARARLPEDSGDEFGERVIAHRRIRIREGPVGTHESGGEVESLGRCFVPGSATASFAKCQPGPDEKRSNVVKTRKQLRRERHEREYIQRVAGLQSESFDDLDQSGFLRHAGTDMAGRHVIVISACKMPASTTSPERMMNYVFRTLDTVVSSDYVIVYLHAQCRKSNKPELTWIRKLYKTMPRKYKKNIKSLYIVHPSVFVKAVAWALKPFVKRKFKSKIRTFKTLAGLFDIFDQKQLAIPREVIAYDQRVNGSDFS